MSVQLPAGFVKLSHYEGYFVNVQDANVYSIKSGELRPLKKQRPNYFNKQLSGWVISVGGRKTQVPDVFVNNLIRSHSVNSPDEFIKVGEPLRRRVIKK